MAKTLVIKTKMDNSEFNSQIEKMNYELEKLEEELEVIESASPYDRQAEDIMDYKSKIEKTKNSLAKLRDKQRDIDSAKFGGMAKEIGSIGSEITKTINKVGRWGLAIFGIRSAYMGIRQLISQVSQYNDQFASQLESIKYTLAMALSPIVERLVNWIYTLVQYIGYLAKAWFKVDIFAKAAEQSSKSATKAAKEMKSIAGYDTANVLSDNSSSSVGSGVLGMSALPDADIPEWVRWIKDHGKEIADILIAIGSGLLAIKLGIGAIQAVGLTMLVYGVADGIKAIIDFMNDPTFNNFIRIIKDIGIAIVGVGLIIGSLPAIVIGAAILIVAAAVKYFDQIMELFDKFIHWLDTSFRAKMHYLFGEVGDFIVDVFIAVVTVAQTLFSNFYGGIKQICNGIVKLFQGDFKYGITEVFKGLAAVMLAPFNLMISAINEIIKGLNRINISVPDWVPSIGGKSWGVNIPTIPQVKFREGGILNNPGRGVPVGFNAIAGESGREAYVPLTNDQALEEIGEKIGKHVTIYANFVNEIDGRVLNKKLETIRSEDRFARNGG